MVVVDDLKIHEYSEGCSDDSVYEDTLDMKEKDLQMHKNNIIHMLSKLDLTHDDIQDLESLR